MADDQFDEAPSGIGSAITEKLTESIKNMDIVSVLQKIVASTPEDEESDAAREKIQGVLEKYNAMSDEERDVFTNQIKNVLASKVSLRLQEKLSGLDETIQEAIVNRIILVVGGAILLLILVVFFGYKLYKSIKEKEIKREEKKKAKQMKKKK